MVKKNPDSLCFYDWVECKDCGLVYPCTPSVHKTGVWLNVPKKCVKCGKKIKQSKRWKKLGFKINDKKYPLIKGNRLLMDCKTPKFKIEESVLKKEYLEKLWGKKTLQKILK